MKSNKMFRIIYSLTIFMLFFLTFYIGFEIIKLKHNIISYIILVIISGCLLQLCVKIFSRRNK